MIGKLVNISMELTLNYYSTNSEFWKLAICPRVPKNGINYLIELEKLEIKIISRNLPKNF